MTEEEYIIDRVDDQIEWYEKKSAINKNRHLNLNVLIIVFAALIPLVTGFGDEIDSALFDGELTIAHDFLVAVFGVLTSIFTGISALYKFQEKWTTYRITGESLKREKILYQTGTMPYNNKFTAFNQFVRNTENLMNEENVNWTQIVNTNEEAPAAEGNGNEVSE